jgi:putative flippase GtrA
VSAGVCGRKPESSSGYESVASRENSMAPSVLVRWLKFNFVGAIGIVVQFGVLFLLKSVEHVHYLVATVVAVEAAVLHNFVWHERFTWADRTMPAWSVRQTLGVKASNYLSAVIAALKRCATQEPLRSSVLRLARFNLANGAVSILGNVSLMKVMVGEGHMNYLVANGIAIAVCSVANFVVSDAWVFEGE